MRLLNRRASVTNQPIIAAGDVSTMPTANLVGVNGATTFNWIHRLGEDFNTDIALGGIYPTTTGSDLGLLNSACPAFAAYGTSFKVKQALSPDTDGNAKYSAVDTMSISNSILNIHNNVHPTNGPVGSSIKLLNQSDTDTNYMTYGRAAIRWRAVADPIAGGTVTGTHWGAVSFFIPDNAHFPIWSEMDWLEANLTSTNPGGFFHPGGDTVNDSAAKAGIGVPFAQWHETVIEWFPEGAGARIRWYDNNILCFNTNVNTAVSPAKLGWLMQTASTGGVPTGDANLQIDWLSVWDYAA